LAVERLDSGTTRQRVLTSASVDDLWIQFAHGPQPCGLSSIPGVQWLAKNELATGRIVAEIEPICCAASCFGQRTRDYASRCSCVHAP
jgi:hypothetical protein